MFLRKANLSAEKQSQIVSAAMSRYEHEPLKDAMPTAIPQAVALRGCVPLHRKQSGVSPAQVVEAQEEEAKEEHVLETNEASDDELEAEHWGNHSPDDQRKTAPSRSGPSETVLSKKSKASKVFRTSNQRGKNTHSKNTLVSSGLKENVVFLNISVSREFARWLFSSWWCAMSEPNWTD